MPEPRSGPYSAPWRTQVCNKRMMKRVQRQQRPGMPLRMCNTTVRAVSAAKMSIAGGPDEDRETTRQGLVRLCRANMTVGLSQTAANVVRLPSRANRGSSASSDVDDHVTIMSQSQSSSGHQKGDASLVVDPCVDVTMTTATNTDEMAPISISAVDADGAGDNANLGVVMDHIFLVTDDEMSTHLAARPPHQATTTGWSTSRTTLKMPFCPWMTMVLSLAWLLLWSQHKMPILNGVVAGHSSSRTSMTMIGKLAPMTNVMEAGGGTIETGGYVKVELCVFLALELYPQLAHSPGSMRSNRRFMTAAPLLRLCCTLIPRASSCAAETCPT